VAHRRDEVAGVRVDQFEVKRAYAGADDPVVPVSEREAHGTRAIQGREALR
jgi:hypothetical protein